MRRKALLSSQGLALAVVFTLMGVMTGLMFLNHGRTLPFVVSLVSATLLGLLAGFGWDRIRAGSDVERSREDERAGAAVLLGGGLLCVGWLGFLAASLRRGNHVLLLSGVAVLAGAVLLSRVLFR